MIRIAIKIYNYFKVHKWQRLLSIIAATVLLITSTCTLGYKEDISDFLPLDSNYHNELDVYQHVSGADKIIVMFRDTIVDNPDNVVSAIDCFSQYISSHNTDSLVANYVYQVDIEHTSELIDYVYSNIPLFLDENDYSRIDSLLSSPDYIERQIAEDKQMLMFPSGGILSENISRDPLNFFTPVVQQLQQGKSLTLFDTYDGYIFVDSMTTGVAMLTSPFGNSETENNAKLCNLLNDAKAEVTTSCKGVDVQIIGGPVIAVGNAQQIKKDSILSISIAVVLICLLLFIFFRSIRNISLIAISIAWGWLFAMGMLALCNDSISLIVIGISSIVLGIAVNYPLHLIAHLSHADSIRSALKEITVPLIVGNITTVGAFAALIPLNSTALRDLGLFSAFLLIGTILFVLIYLPHVVKHKKVKSSDTSTDGNLHQIKHKRYIVSAIALITVVLGYYSIDTKFNTNMNSINYMTQEQRDNMSKLQNLTQGLDKGKTNLYVVSTANNIDSALSKAQQNRQIITAHLPNLKFSTCEKFVPSNAEQVKRIAAWNEFWADRRARIEPALRAAMAAEGFAENSFDEFLSTINTDSPANNIDDSNPLIALYASQIQTSNNGIRIVDVVTVDTDNAPKIEQQIESVLPADAYCFNIQGLNAVIASNLSDNFNYIGWVCGAIVFIFLLISLGRIELATIAFMPMAISWIWILGLMSIFDIQFNIVNIILATFIFGQGDDYTIFMTEGCMSEYAYRRRMVASFRKSILISAAIMFIGIGSLIFARHPALFSLAQVTIIGMLSVVIMSFVIPPIMFEWLTKQGGKYRKRPLMFTTLLRTWYCGTVWISQLLVGYAIAFVMTICGSRTLNSRRHIHWLISKIQKLDICKLMPGISCTIRNEYGETFEKPCIIICNHQSMLDPVCILALHPRILMIGNEKSSLHPLMRIMYKWLNFYTVRKDNHTQYKDHTFERDLPLFKEYIKEGYSIAVYPEGVRNPDSKIVRYHKGPFYLAKELGVDIVPVFIHGLNNIMPIGSFAANSGSINIIVEKRITPESPLWDNDYQIMTKQVHQFYIKRYAELKREFETPRYFEQLVKDRYLYKGSDIYLSIKKHLKQNDCYSKLISQLPDEGVIVVEQCGYGELPLLIALVKPNLTIYALDDESDKMLVADYAAEQIVGNVHFGQMPQHSDIIIKLNDKGQIV